MLGRMNCTTTLLISNTEILPRLALSVVGTASGLSSGRHPEFGAVVSEGYIVLSRCAVYEPDYDTMTESLRWRFRRCMDGLEKFDWRIACTRGS